MTAQTILPANSVTGGYEVANSLRFNSGSSDDLTKTFSAGNGTTWTYSFWIKRNGDTSHNTTGVYTDGNNRDLIVFTSDGKFQWYSYQSGAYAGRLQTNRLFRDSSAWYHVVLKWDTNNDTANDRMQIYINGVQETSFAARVNPGDGGTSLINSNIALTIGQSSGSYLSGYMSEVCFIDGTALDADSFGEFDEDSGIWKPKSVSGLTFGTNGFYLETKQSGTGTNASGLGADTSGNGNHFAVNNLTAVDQSTDTCTNNFATMNSLAVPPANAPTFTEGNLKISTNNANANPVLSTIGVSQGKWYVECKRISFDSGSADDGFRIGFGTTHVENVNLVPPGISNSGHYFMIGNGTVYNGSTDLGDKAGDSNISDDGVVGIALDLDNNRISWSFDGVWMTGSNAWSGSSPSSYVDIASGYTYFFLQTDGSTGRGYTAGWNFGGTSAFAISSGNADANGHGNFEFAPPSGYFALCTKNLAEYGG